MLDDKNKELLEYFGGYLIDKPNRLCFKNENGIINIPSKKFPVGEPVEVFSHFNTDSINNERIEELFNSIAFEVGRCYTNVKMFIDLLRENNINNVYPYAGWLIVGRGLPKHHSFLVMKEDNKNYLFDFSANFTSEELSGMFGDNMNPDMDKSRQTILKSFQEKEKLKNSEKCGFGKVDPLYLYIAEKKEPYVAADEFLQLMDAYPDHMSYKTTDMRTGMSPFQEMYYKSKNRTKY